MQGTQATLRWTPASGPVTGYQVVVARNGQPPHAEALITKNEVTLRGSPGELMQVSVRAYGFPNGPSAPSAVGPFSEPSEAIRFLGTPIVKSGLAVLDCADCGRVQVLAIPSAMLLKLFSHLPGWDLIRFADFAGSGSAQALLRERASGALWIGDITTNGLVPLASVVEGGFATRWPTRPTDFDGDGASEFVLRDPVTGSADVWGVVRGVLTRRITYSLNPAWTLFATDDQDGDGQADLWIDTHRGQLSIVRTRNFNVARLVAVPVPWQDYAAVDVADYDGDGQLDVIWRRADGALALTLLHGDPAAPQAEIYDLPALPGDENFAPRTSVDLDGVPGAEIVLQNEASGAVDVLAPFGATPGARQRLLQGDPRLRLVQATH